MRFLRSGTHTVDIPVSQMLLDRIMACKLHKWWCLYIRWVVARPTQYLCYKKHPPPLRAKTTRPNVGRVDRKLCCVRWKGTASSLLICASAQGFNSFCPFLGDRIDNCLVQFILSCVKTSLILEAAHIFIIPIPDSVSMPVSVRTTSRQAHVIVSSRGNRSVLQQSVEARHVRVNTPIHAV